MPTVFWRVSIFAAPRAPGEGEQPEETFPHRPQLSGSESSDVSHPTNPRGKAGVCPNPKRLNPSTLNPYLRSSCASAFSLHHEHQARASSQRRRLRIALSCLVRREVTLCTLRTHAQRLVCARRAMRSSAARIQTIRQVAPCCAIWENNRARTLSSEAQ